MRRKHNHPGLQPDPSAAQGSGRQGHSDSVTDRLAAHLSRMLGRKLQVLLQRPVVLEAVLQGPLSYGDFEGSAEGEALAVIRHAALHSPGILLISHGFLDIAVNSLHGGYQHGPAGTDWIARSPEPFGIGFSVLKYLARSLAGFIAGAMPQVCSEQEFELRRIETGRHFVPVMTVDTPVIVMRFMLQDPSVQQPSAQLSSLQRAGIGMVFPAAVMARIAAQVMQPVPENSVRTQMVSALTGAELTLTGELGPLDLRLGDVTRLNVGAFLELPPEALEQVRVMAEGKPIAIAELGTQSQHACLRITRTLAGA